MEESAAERRARLKAMREAAAQDKDDGPAQEEPERPAAEPSSQQAGPSKPAQPLLKLRNYNLKDQASIPHTNVEPVAVPEPDEIVADVEDEAVALAEKDPIDSALPTRKPNWDLRRAIAPQLAMLDRRTQEAIVTLMKQEEANPGSISAMPS